MRKLSLVVFASMAGAVALAAPPSKGPDPSAPLVVVDSTGKVVGPVVSLPNTGAGAYNYLGDIGAAYRVGTAVARVGFLVPPPGASAWTYGVLSDIRTPVHVRFAAANCTGQAYLESGLPADYRAYSPVFVMPAYFIGQMQVLPARVMQQTTRTATVTPQSSTSDEGACVNGTYSTKEYVAADVISAFPFVGPYSLK